MAIAAALAGAAIGGVGAALLQPGEQTTTSTSRVNLGQANRQEVQGFEVQQQQFNSLQDLLQAGTGREDVLNAFNAQRDLAALFGTAAESGGLPSQVDITASQDIANNLFGAQRVQQQQAFNEQRTQADRQAALLGRQVNDPILRARLAQQQTEQSAVLAAQQGATAQQLALALPQQRLNFASQRAQILGGLGSQAIANRQALLNLGAGIGQQERDFRLQTADRTGSQTTPGASTGQRIGAALTGAIGGAGAGLSLGSAFAAPQPLVFAQAPAAFGGPTVGSSFGLSGLGSYDANTFNLG